MEALLVEYLWWFKLSVIIGIISSVGVLASTLHTHYKLTKGL